MLPYRLDLVFLLAQDQHNYLVYKFSQIVHYTVSL